MAKTKRRCIFCGAEADSYEHIFADWINELITPGEGEALRFDVERGGVQRVHSYPTKKVASQRAKIVCERCNHGWMSDLETEASALLGPAILGHEARWDMAQQLLAATWAVKTAMVGETIQYQRDSFSQEDRELMRLEQRPPLRAHVSVAAYAAETSNATRYMRGLGEVRSDGAPFMELYVHTIQVLHLVLSVRGTPTFPASDNRSLENIAEPHYLEIPVFPPVEHCRWPPNLIMDEATLLEYAGMNNIAFGP